MKDRQIITTNLRPPEAANNLMKLLNKYSPRKSASATTVSSN
jgi:hypothetical protein